MKKVYEKYRKELEKMKQKISSYKEVKDLYQEMIDCKPDTIEYYKKDKEIAQWYALSMGLFACSINFQEEKEKEEYREDAIVYFSLLTNISNAILAIVQLVDNGFEFQANLIMRNLMELLYTLLVVLINKEKRKEYFDSGMLQNEYSVWNKNFRMTRMSEELSEYESDFFDEEFIEKLRVMRKEIYQYYSSYIHNDYAFCALSCYSPKQDDSDEEPYLEYNLWGRYNYAGKKILNELNRNMWIIMLYFKHIISRKEYFNRENYISEETKEFWNDALIILFMLEEEMKSYCKD